MCVHDPKEPDQNLLPEAGKHGEDTYFCSSCKNVWVPFDKILYNVEKALEA